MSGTWRGNWLVTRGVVVVLLGALVLATGGCGGGGSSGGGAAATTTTTSTKTEGIDVPEKVETVPDNNANGKAGQLLKGVVATGISSITGTDYDNDQLNLKVAIKALERFEIVDQVLGAIDDTGYADARVVNKGPYAAMVAFEEERGKSLEKWIVDSKMLVENGKDVNVISAWIDDGDEYIKAQFKIWEAPTATNSYGVWRIDAGFYNATTNALVGFFVASSELTADGKTLLQINLSEDEEAGRTFIVKSKLYLKNDAGSGIITFNEPWAMVPTEHTARYSYDVNHVIISVDGATARVYSRSVFHDVYMDYHVYTAAGENIRKTKQFGIPLRYSDSTTGKDYFLHYGGWMGRHQLWTPFTLNLPEGAVLTSSDYGNDGAQYTLAKKYMGYLVEKTLVDGSLNEIKGETLQAWINNGYDVVYVTNHWEGWNPATQAADGVTHPTTEFINDPANHKNVFLFKWYPFPGNPVSVDQSGNFLGYVPQNGDRITVNVSEPVFVSYTGTGWVRYMTVTFTGWEPTVSNPQAYSFPRDDRIYLNSKGVNYILNISGTGTAQQTLTLKKELENVIQPGAEALARDGWQFTTFDNETYTFDWDPTTLGIKLTNATTGAEQTTSIWYMTKSGDTIHSYSWQYAQDATETWNIMVYLKDAAGNWVFLDDPIFFDPITVNGMTINSLGYDGHLFGIPDVWQMMNGPGGPGGDDWALTNDMLAKIVNIPAGTILTEKGTTTTYLIKPIFGLQFLETVTSGYTVAIDTTLTLDNLITFTDPGIGAMPTINTITVQEGTFLTP